MDVHRLALLARHRLDLCVDIRFLGAGAEPIPFIGWCAPPLLYSAAVSSRRRRLDRQPQTPHCGKP